MSTALQNSPAAILRQWAVTGSTSLFTMPEDNSEWPMSVEAMPDGEGVPDEYATMRDTSGVFIGRILDSKRNVYTYGIQIKVRSLSSPGAYAILSELCGRMEEIHFEEVVIGDNTYIIDVVNQPGPILSLGQDEARRSMYTVNVLLMLIGP